jgi:hypothetical protein
MTAFTVTVGLFTVTVHAPRGVDRNLYSLALRDEGETLKRVGFGFNRSGQQYHGIIVTFSRQKDLLFITVNSDIIVHKDRRQEDVIRQIEVYRSRVKRILDAVVCIATDSQDAIKLFQYITCPVLHSSFPAAAAGRGFVVFFASFASFANRVHVQKASG